MTKTWPNNSNDTEPSLGPAMMRNTDTIHEFRELYELSISSNHFCQSQPKEKYDEMMEGQSFFMFLVYLQWAKIL